MQRLAILIALGLGLGLGLGLSATAHAEKADSSKELVIYSNSAGGTNVRQVGNLIGDVVLARGTLEMKAGKASVKEDPEGYSFVTLWAEPGKLATFRQKRDGGPDLWIEGQAERIEYDSRNEVIKLFAKARIVQLTGTRVTDEINSAFFSYDSRTENFSAENTATGESKVGGGRVKIVLQPANKTPPPPATPGKK